MSVREIIKLVKHLELPLSIQSSAVYIYIKSQDKLNLDYYNKLYISVLVACKSENVHGYLKKLMSNLKGISMEKIYAEEVKLFRILNYDFNFPHPYNNLCTLKLLYESGGNISKYTWEESVQRLEYILPYLQEGYLSSELAVSSLELPFEFLEKIKFDRVKIEHIKTLTGHLNKLQQK